MERRKFIQQCSTLGFSCLGLSVILNSCTATHHVAATVNNTTIQLNSSEFIVQKGDKITYRKYIIVRTENSDVPIVVYRFSSTDFKALLLRCTHQANELNVNGDLISCSAHGSEFTNKGEVSQGPAEQSLKSFPVKADEHTIHISLT